MGGIGGVLRATSGPPKYSTVSSVKNTALQGLIDNNINGFGATQSGINKALDTYQNKYMAGEGAAAANTGQEVGSIDKFYNGEMANQLAQLRTQRKSAMTDAANVASQQAIAAQNRSQVGGQGGGSSYATRMTMANLTPIRTQAALDDANQSRADLGYLTDNQVGLAGRRNAMNEKQAGYGLVPQQQRMQMLGQEAGYMGQLGNLDQQNKFYGLQAAPNMWADVADSLDQGVLNGVAAASSMSSMMARGGIVRGPGTGTSDSIPVRLSKGEYVIPAEALHMTGVLPLLDRIRKIALKHREERMLHGHLVNHDMFKRGMHPVHGKVMDEMVGKLKKAHVEKVESASRGYARGGLVRGYANGGPIMDTDMMTDAEFNSMGGGKKGGGGGGGASGLTGSAQQLGDRAMKDLTPQWGNAVLIGDTSPSGGVAPRSSAPSSAPVSPMPQSGGMTPRSPYFQPSNYNEIPQNWKDYANKTAEYYNSPKSPGYIPAGSYE